MPRRKRTFPLTNTSSVSKVLPARRKSKQMRDKKQFEVEYQGIIIRCPSAEEAIRIAKQLATSPKAPELLPWRVDEFTEFVNRIQWQQRKLLDALIRAEGQVHDYDLCGQLQLTGNQALAGVLSGVTKVALAMELDPKRVYGQSVFYNKGLPERKYWVTDAFKHAARQHDWPTYEDLLEPSSDEE